MVLEIGGHRAVTAAELFHLVEAILLKAGLHPAQAVAVTRVIVAAERDDCKSHGVYRIEGVLRTVRDQRLWHRIEGVI